MTDWSEYTIGECCDVLDHLRVPINAEKRENIAGDIPYYGANGVQGYIDRYIFDEDLILMAEDGGNFEQFATRPVAYRISGKSWVNNHAHVLRAKKGFDQAAIFYALVHKNILPFIVGGTRSKLNQTELTTIKIRLPQNEEEQTWIGEVLSCIDRGIEWTEALIAKENRIRTGLMQDLFSKGVDKLNNIRSDITHEFEESRVGSIPIEWHVRSLGNVGEWFSGGTPSKSNPRFWNGSFPWASSKDMKQLRLSDTEDHITEDAVKSGTRLVPKNTILIVVRGMVLAHTFPVALTTTKMAFNQDLKACVCNSEISPSYLAYYLAAHGEHLLRLTTAATHGTKRIDSKELFEYEFALPKDEKEQDKILEIIATSESQLLALKDDLAKLIRIKRGLLQDLFTGDLNVEHLLAGYTSCQLN